ncbi:bisanhydrobacterioruberin hydratase CruF [Methanothermobacter sp.]|uniref:bisanhydrobacterioruberin hydratase CruF n=1 Tax=Methanothermobacter sp. TaxID=1884223 RepID=UPI003C782027
MNRPSGKSIIILLVGIILAFSSYFVTRVNIGGYSAVSVVFIISMALPSFISIIRDLRGRGVILILVLGAYAILIETAAIVTGFPYSEFHYTGLIGLKILGHTPFTVPFAWLPLFLGSAYLAKESTGGKLKFLGLSTILVVLTDVVIDPAAVALNFWVWSDPGIFYAVPLQNFAGWVLSGFIASLILLVVLGDSVKEMKAGTISSLYLIMCFWTAACLFLGLEIPFITGLTLLALILIKTGSKLW